MLTFDTVLQKALALNPSLNEKRLRSAYEYAEKIHAGSYRITGDPAILHVLLVTNTLLSLTADEDALITAFLHNIYDSKDFNPDTIEKLFGKSVRELLTSYAILSKIQTIADDKAQLESLRKMFLVMAKHIRVVMLRLADRLEIMKTLEYFPISEQKYVARETLNIYVPISARLGIYTVKTQLEDLCFKHLNKPTYEDLKQQLQEYLSHRGKTIEEMKIELSTFLKKQGIEAEVQGRIKNIYNIYKKLKLKEHTTLYDIYDIFAIRIILPSKFKEMKSEKIEQTDHLYSVLGLIHNRWKPLGMRFKDYIAMPKPNGYRSLHTAVLGLSSNSFSHPTEIQIRSRAMHEEAEFGVASHWFYKDMKKVLGSKNKDVVFDSIKENIQWFSSLAQIHEDIAGAEHTGHDVTLDLFSDRIFVLTPTGSVRDLPVGSTPIDFAYAVHSDLGNHCHGVKVNGSIVPLQYQLNNGEVVEIITNPKAQPKAQWLSFVKTASAKNKIRAYLRSNDKERNFREGKEILNKILHQMHKPLLDESLSIFRVYQGKKMSLKDRVGFVEEVGNGSVVGSSLLRGIFGDSMSSHEVRKVPSSLPAKPSIPSQVNEITINGGEGVPYRYAVCCKPDHGKPIIGYVSRKNVITIHLESCKMLRHTRKQRTLEAYWHQDFHTKKLQKWFMFKAVDRVGLLRDITEIIAFFHANILEIKSPERSGKEIQQSLLLEVLSLQVFENILTRLARVRNIIVIKPLSNELQISQNKESVPDTALKNMM